MADRTVKVTLRMEAANYLANTEAARKATAKVTDSIEAQKAASIAAAKAQGEAAGKIGQSLLAVGVLAAAGVAVAVKSFSEFDQAMSNVAAATHESEENMGRLRDAALDAGAKTVFSATEAANAIEELGKAGLTTDQILSGGLNGALSLAAAGQLEVADAAQIAAIAVKQFNLEGSDVPHVADLLAAGAGKAVGDVSDLSAALGQAGLVANGAGQSIEDTTGVLAAFADAGLLGSDSGTSLKSTIIALQAPTAKSKALMEQYNLSFYDGNQKMLSFDKIAGQLQSNMGGLGDETRNAALAQIFGNDALRAANVLYSQGQKGIQQYIDQTNDAGYAADTAAARLDNLAGDVEALGGSMDTALIKSGSAANGSLRFLTQSATGAVNAFGELPEPLQGVALGIGAITAASALGAGGFLTLVPKVTEYRDSLEKLGPSAQKANKVVGVAMKGIGVVAGISTAIAVLDQLDASLQGTGASVTELSNAFTQGNVSDAVEKAFLGAGSFTDSTVNIEKFGKALDDVAASGLDTRWAGVFGPMIGWLDGTDEATDVTRDALEKMGETFAGMTTVQAQSALKGLRSEYDLTDKQILTLINSSGPYKDALIAQADKTGALADDQTLLKIALEETAPPALAAADAYLAASDKAAALNDGVLELIKSVNEANGVGQDAVTSNADYRKSLDEVNEYIQKAKDGVEGYSLGMDQNTAAGSANASMLADHAAKAQESADAMYAADGNMEAYKARLEGAHQTVYDSAIALGANADEAQAIADNLAAIPSETAFKVIADTGEAAARLQHIRDLINNMPGAVELGPGVSIQPFAPVKKATGGAVFGAGTATSDSIPALLSNSEHVMTAADVDAMGGHANVYAFRRSLHRGYAGGGEVGYATQPQYVQSGHTYGGNSSSVTTKKSINNTFNVTDGPSANELAEAVLAKQNYQERSW